MQQTTEKMTMNSPRVAINVMRARLTVVAFNLAVVSLQLAVLPKLPGAVQMPGSSLSLHLGTDINLLLGLALSIISLVLFIASSQLDEQGNCTHPSLVAGDLFMYLGLAQSASGFFAPFTALLGQTGLPEAESVRLALMMTGGSAWFLAMYLGPVVSLCRSPFNRTINLGLWLGYVILLALVALVSGQGAVLQAAHSGESLGGLAAFSGALVAPFNW